MKISNLKINKKVLSIITAFQIALSSGTMANCFITSDMTKHASGTNSSIIIKNNESFSFDDNILDSSVVLQNDERFSNISYNAANIRQAGCGPVSITNALILAFNIDSNNVSYLLNDVMSLDSRYTYITDYMIGNNDTNTYVLSEIKKSFSGKIIYGENNSQKIISNIKSNNMNDTYIFGTLNYNYDNCHEIIGIIDYLYNSNPDTNIILYNMSAGILSSGNPFGSYSNSGHYITLLINVKEFKENNSIYIIDSVAKNLRGETNHRVNYNFIETPCEVNNLYNISRVSEGILKLTGKDKINTKCLSFLELDGGCGIIICPNNLTKKMERAISSR